MRPVASQKAGKASVPRIQYFWCLAAVHGAIGVFALYRMARRSAVPLDDQTTLVPITSQASPVATSVAPRAIRDAMDADLARMSRH